MWALRGRSSVEWALNVMWELKVQNEKRVVSRGKDMCEVLGLKRMW